MIWSVYYTALVRVPLSSLHAVAVNFAAVLWAGFLDFNLSDSSVSAYAGKFLAYMDIFSLYLYYRPFFDCRGVPTNVSKHGIG